MCLQYKHEETHGEQITESQKDLMLHYTFKNTAKTKFSMYYARSLINWLFELIYVIPICTFFKVIDEFNCTAANEKTVRGEHNTS